MLERPPGGATMRLLAERTPSSTWVPAVGNAFPEREKGERDEDKKETGLIFRASDGKRLPGLISQETSILVCQAFQAFCIHPPGEHPFASRRARLSPRYLQTLSIIKNNNKKTRPMI